MAFVDSIGGYIAAKAGEGPSVTANFNANFMRPAPVGAWIEGTGKALKVGRKAIFIRVELTLEKKLIFPLACSNNWIIPREWSLVYLIIFGTTYGIFRSCRHSQFLVDVLLIDDLERWELWLVCLFVIFQLPAVV